MLNFGIDVSRDKLDCAVLDEQGQRVKRLRTFANDNQGVFDLIAWARSIAVDQPRRFVMEATAAAYHELAATRLHGAGLVISVVNPAGSLAGARPWHAQQDGRHRCGLIGSLWSFDRPQAVATGTAGSGTFQCHADAP